MIECDSITTDDSQSKTDQGSIEARDKWANRWQFLLSVIGLSVGIGNVWRFPYIAYENGGGAFLVPYLIMLSVAGRPMYFLELAFGQFTSKGILSIWSCAPIMKGVGYAMLGLGIMVTTYYNVIMAYSLHYIYNSFRSVLPWTICQPQWADCYVRSAGSMTNQANRTIAAQLYWERSVLDISNGIAEIGGIKWDLALALLLAWVIVIACIAKGIKTSGRLVYFSATFPYVLLLILMVVGLTREGAWTGVVYFLRPDFNKLLTIKVWQAAASQCFYTLGVAEGAVITLSSYNHFRHNIYKDAIIISVLDTLTSIIAGVVIFSVLGSLSHELGVPMDKVVESGTGLTFIIYPEALSRLPWPQLWTFLFFFMFIVLGVDTQFAALENIITAISDEFEVRRAHRLPMAIVLGIVCYLIGLTCVTRGGPYVFEIFDYYGAGMPYLLIAIAEILTISWVYGYRNFARDVSFMLNRSLGPYWMITWKYTAPIALILIAIASFAEHIPLERGTYQYPSWANAGGWGLTMLILAQIPIWSLVALLRQPEKGLKEKIRAACKPNLDWGPQELLERQNWRDHMRQLGHGVIRQVSYRV